jgi:hypothetical protein
MRVEPTAGGFDRGRWAGRCAWAGALALVGLLIGLAPAPADAAHAGSAVRVTDLRTEYAENPLGIDQRRPRLSWGARVL